MRGRYKGISIDIDASDVLDELDDEDIIEEVDLRKLGPTIVARIAGSRKLPPSDAPLRLDDIQADLMAKRSRQAEDGLRKLIDDLVGRDLTEALDAIRGGRLGDAICHIENHRPRKLPEKLPPKGSPAVEATP